ncbi:hypothetical protein Leryth_005706 [Lithospermum erythrorhizon]|nr:hypothetical protein Leryth_005706 [Lithospermum erythrorhizon]
MNLSESTLNNLVQNFTYPIELKQIHANLIKSSVSPSILPLKKVTSVCALTTNFSYAQQIFRRLNKPEVIFWNCSLRDFAESKNPFNAILLFYQMREHNVCIDSFTCSYVLKACKELHDLVHGRIIYSYIEKLGYQKDLFLMNLVVHLYASCGDFDAARMLFDQMVEKDVVTWNIMITHLVKRGDVDGAYELFKEMPERSVRSWTSMIAGFVQCCRPKDALGVFVEMEEAGFRGNEVTVVAVLAACADVGDLDLGKRIHQYSSQMGFERNIRVCNTLIDMYIKCGCLDAARGVFREMKKRTVVSWSAMIQGLAMHGAAEEALKLFSEMIQTGVRPNDVTFIGLLHACSHMGLVNAGREFFASMNTDYGITPRIEHYGCMVDLLSRAGLLQEAREFIRTMPIQPNGVVWGALLGGCQVHKNIELAEEAIKHLQDLDPLNDGYYIVLSNIYADAKRWEDTARVRKLMRDRGVKKTPGRSIVTIKGAVHEFVAGDDTHPQSNEIAQTWDELLQLMKSKGYEPNTDVVLLDVEESEKEKFLYRHSEKLALVSGLINTSEGETVRIMKNLRVCEDCHAAFKVISEIVDREIIVRDRNRFHCFKQGSCSCGDYW